MLLVNMGVNGMSESKLGDIKEQEQKEQSTTLSEEDLAFIKRFDLPMDATKWCVTFSDVV